MSSAHGSPFASSVSRLSAHSKPTNHKIDFLGTFPFWDLMIWIRHCPSYLCCRCSNPSPWLFPLRDVFTCAAVSSTSALDCLPIVINHSFGCQNKSHVKGLPPTLTAAVQGCSRQLASPLRSRHRLHTQSCLSAKCSIAMHSIHLPFACICELIL